MRLIIASNNKHKIKEIKTILADKFDEILSLSEAGISHETVEDGKTFIENALKKAREIAELSGECALADDSGITAHALGDEPGVFSARYAGTHEANAADEENNKLLLKNLNDKADRTAHYTAAIALVYPDGRQVTAEGYMYGTLIDAPRGTAGFGYDPIFVPDGEVRTVAEMTPEEKNKISHRAKALVALLGQL
jgi:XTP/dITP diphosphohydrolase